MAAATREHGMIRMGLVMTAGCVWAGAAAAQSTEMNVYGPGTISCATYLQDRSIRINADGWILGFWTGSNRTAQEHGVGKSTDSRGIVGEVALACRNHPSVSLFQTEKEVYDRMKGEGR